MNRHLNASPPALCFKPGRTRELVVSAGESVEVTLPRNEVELNAFVIPTPPEGKSTNKKHQKPLESCTFWPHLASSLPYYGMFKMKR